jgi:hypothetical protein
MRHSQLESALRAVLAVDLAIKGIEQDGGPSDLLLEVMVMKLCHDESGRVENRR